MQWLSGIVSGRYQRLPHKEKEDKPFGKDVALTSIVVPEGSNPKSKNTNAKAVVGDSNIRMHHEFLRMDSHSPGAAAVLGGVVVCV